MPEPADPAAPSTPQPGRRPRKFVLPEHHHDERGDQRTAGHIEAFLTMDASGLEELDGAATAPLAEDLRVRLGTDPSAADELPPP